MTLRAYTVGCQILKIRCELLRKKGRITKINEQVKTGYQRTGKFENYPNRTMLFEASKDALDGRRHTAAGRSVNGRPGCGERTRGNG